MMIQDIDKPMTYDLHSLKDCINMIDIARKLNNIIYQKGDLIRMRAKFIGKKPSMGFIPGQVYEIDSYIQYIMKVGHVCICIYDVTDKSKWCPYDSINGIFKNWRPL